jgi:hypothetical protein
MCRKQAQNPNNGLPGIMLGIANDVLLLLSSERQNLIASVSQCQLPEWLQETRCTKHTTHLSISGPFLDPHQIVVYCRMRVLSTKIRGINKLYTAIPFTIPTSGRRKWCTPRLFLVFSPSSSWRSPAVLRGVG